jgi:hypothetical protein
MGDNLPYNENYKKTLYLDAVFKKYGTTEAVFDSSLVWYTRNTEVLSKIYEKVSKRLKAQQNEINHLIALRDNKPKMSEPGDSIDVWPWKRLIRLTGEMMNDQYAFVLPADTNYKDRDTLVWEVRYHFLEPMLADSLRAVTMAMQVIYEKDTLNRLETITDPGVHQLRLYADTLGVMKEIKVLSITKDSEEFKELTGWMKKIGKSVEAATARIRPAIADEHYLQGEDVCEMLHISKRTLQTLRDEGAIPYTTIGGKILYPESALYETLRKNYRNYRQYAG